MILAECIPNCGMIFVPSVKGISHQGEEYTAPHHVDLGADVLYETVLELDENGLEQMGAAAAAIK